jgi:hypothetical protein
MRPERFSSSFSWPRMKPSSSRSAPEPEPEGPALKRADSLPSRLPSNSAQRTEAELDRTPITRPIPDTEPPTDIRPYAPDGTRQAAEIKERFVKALDMSYMEEGLWEKVETTPHYFDFLKSAHPNYMSYTPEQRVAAIENMAFSHPMLSAEMAHVRNVHNTVPNSPTASRTMRPDEQKFLTVAFQRIQEDVRNKPFHIHGESAVIANRDGEITYFGHNPAGAMATPIREGDTYHLHTHPPFAEPFTSSASEMDHLVSAQLYLGFDNKTNTYVTNGKDVLQIAPDSLHLVKLNPDPKVEEQLGKFPEAFKVPDPQLPPRPFSNHEAPAAFKEGWQPPAGWKPPERFWAPPKRPQPEP